MTIKGYHKRLATRAAMDYRMVDLIGSSVARLMSKDAKFPTLEQAYPNLLSSGRPAEQTDEDIKTARIKNWLLTYAEANNAKRRGNTNG